MLPWLGVAESEDGCGSELNIARHFILVRLRQRAMILHPWTNQVSKNKVENMSKFAVIEKGSVTSPQGYRAAGVIAAIKKPKPDMALVVSDTEAVVAGTFTTNKIQGNTVKLCKQLLKGRKARAIIVNSGNANACNGPQGLADARRMGALTASELKIPRGQVFVCSTGTIGLPMPMDKVEAGIKLAAISLSRDGGASAARAIMTTDTVEKQFAVGLTVDRKPVVIAGMAKGAGMIEPNMATMLSFITTDAAVAPAALQECLSAAVNQSYNRITVDGDQSCNDTVLLLANGHAGNSTLNRKHPAWSNFCAAVNEVTRQLAIKIVKDGEGATKFVTVKVKGAVSAADAALATRAVANSLLVKTAWFGGDPNWGRVIDAVGYSGAMVKEEKVDIDFDGKAIVRKGRRAPGVELAVLEAIFKQREFTVEINLHLGKGEDTVYTCDCSYDYVKINSEYMT